MSLLSRGGYEPVPDAREDFAPLSTEGTEVGVEADRTSSYAALKKTMIHVFVIAADCAVLWWIVSTVLHWFFSLNITMTLCGMAIFWLLVSIAMDFRRSSIRYRQSLETTQDYMDISLRLQAVFVCCAIMQLVYKKFGGDSSGSGSGAGHSDAGPADIDTMTASTLALNSTQPQTQTQQLFDSLGRYILRDFDLSKPMSNFLSGVGGLWGIPMWVFYVNRGQGLASFGLQNKDGGIGGFLTAEKAYQATPFTGFRTFVRGERETGECFSHQPFFPYAGRSETSTPSSSSSSSSASNEKPPQGASGRKTTSTSSSSSGDSSGDSGGISRDMHVGRNEMEIVERNPSLGLTTSVLYYTVPNQNFPALIRKTTFTNTGTGSLNLEILDGLGKLFPSGLTYGALNAMGRTLEAWMKVFNVGSGESGGHISQPFFHITQGFADTSTVTLVKAGHFALSFIEEEGPASSSGLHAPLGYVVDPNVVYGWDTSLMNARGFFDAPIPSSASAAAAAAAMAANSTDDNDTVDSSADPSPSPAWSMGDFLRQAQGTTSRTPCAFAGATKKGLRAGDSFTLTTVIGHAPDLDTFVTDISPIVRKPGFSQRAYEQNEAIMEGISHSVDTDTSNSLLDGYIRQDYLDNVLRGGLPLLLLDGMADGATAAATAAAPATDVDSGASAASAVKGQGSPPNPSPSADANPSPPAAPAPAPARPQSSISASSARPALPKVFHAFSRIHGDLERDYNDFLIDTTFLSQGPGNFRDVCQNRRLDTLMNPEVGSFNLHMFLSLIQADGFNPLTVASTLFRVSADQVGGLLDALGVIDPGSVGLRKAVETLLTAPWRPGQLFADFGRLGITFAHPTAKLLPLLVASADQFYAAAFAQNGFWTDHWTYIQDLLDTFLMVFPDQEEAVLWDSQKVPFYFSPAVVKPRRSRYSLVPNPNAPSGSPYPSTLRVLSAVSTPVDAAYPPERTAEYAAIWQGKGYVGDTTGAGALWQRASGSGSGSSSGGGRKDKTQEPATAAEQELSVFKVTVITKLTMLALLKFGTMDPRGMGVEMEGGKPGWNDAMNGLPGLLGSGMPETYETLRLTTYLRGAVLRYSRPVEFPAEFSEYLSQLAAALDAFDAATSPVAVAASPGEPAAAAGAAGAAAGAGAANVANTNADADLAYWNATATAREAYRERTAVHFTGQVAAMPAAALAALLARAVAKLEAGVSKALATVARQGHASSASSGAGHNAARPATAPSSASSSSSVSAADVPPTPTPVVRSLAGVVSPTYFWYECTAYETFPSNAATGESSTSSSSSGSSTSTSSSSSSSSGSSGANPTAFATHTLPLFLEGPTRHLKVLHSAEEKRQVYLAVRGSPLYDRALQMFTISSSLASVGPEVGRMVAFTPGWLENQSVWLHMSYKFYLELLRGGLYEEFYLEISTGMVPFMNPAVYGRSPVEASSFIVSSAFPDARLRGGGYLARLSGSTAEMLSIWACMFIGPAPFSMTAPAPAPAPLEHTAPAATAAAAAAAGVSDKASAAAAAKDKDKGKAKDKDKAKTAQSQGKAPALTLQFRPALPGWMFRAVLPSGNGSSADGVASFTFLGRINVTYHNPSLKDSWKLNVTHMVITSSSSSSSSSSSPSSSSPSSSGDAGNSTKASLKQEQEQAQERVDGAVVRGLLAERVRSSSGGVVKIDVYF